MFSYDANYEGGPGEKGDWYTFYLDSGRHTDEFCTMANFNRSYERFTGLDSSRLKVFFDLDEYTYIVCRGITLHRFACFPFQIDEWYYGKAYVKLDDAANRVNIYRIKKFSIGIADPYAHSSDDWTVVLPRWFPG